MATSSTRRVFLFTALVFLFTITILDVIANFLPRVNIHVLISNIHLVHVIFKIKNQHRHSNEDIKSELCYPITASSPVPEKYSESQRQIIGALDVLEKREGRIYFLVPNVRSLTSYAMFLPDLQIDEQIQNQLSIYLRYASINDTSQQITANSSSYYSTVYDYITHQTSSVVNDTDVYANSTNYLNNAAYKDIENQTNSIASNSHVNFASYLNNTLHNDIKNQTISIVNNSHVNSTSYLNNTAYNDIENHTISIVNDTNMLHSNIPQVAPVYPIIHPFFQCYRNLQGSYMTSEFLQKRYPHLVEVINIGQSYLKTIDSGGHEMQVLKLTSKYKTLENTVKPPLFILCGIHPRELAPTEACARFAEDILEQYGKDADKTWILDFNEIHMVMQANPDGREDEEKQLAKNNINYLRRKNMHACQSCLFACYRENGSRFGVDLNRNFPHSAWGTAGVGARCDSTYPGTGPASEPETQAIVNYMESVLPPGTNTVHKSTGAYTAEAMGIMIDIHSYGEDFFWPYAFSDSIFSPNDQDLKDFAEKMASFTTPRYSSTNEVYLSSGDTTDWAHEAIGVAAYTVELGTKFYESCQYFEDYIEGNTLRVLLYAARVAKAPYSLPKGPDIMSITLSSTMLKPTDILVATVKANNERNPLTRETEVTSISLFIDKHPYLAANNSSSSVIKSPFDLNDEEVIFNVPFTNLSTGQHTAFFQAQDNNLLGPVYSAFFEVRI